MDARLTPGDTVVLRTPLRWGGVLHPVGSRWRVFRVTSYPRSACGPVYLLNPEGGTPIPYGPIATTDDVRKARP